MIFLAFTVVFLCFPRSRFSELEKRELAVFPEINNYKGKISAYPADISTWFSDSEPYRDFFMTLSMQVRDAMGFSFGDEEEAISFKSDGGIGFDPGVDFMFDEDLEASGNPMANENAKKSNSGTIVVGKGANVRALSAFGAGTTGATPYINAVKEYAQAFPDLNVYAMVVPLATEFYLPEKGSSLSKPQKPVIEYVKTNIPSSVKWVDAYSYLAAHTNEDIYLRTDHHWAPRGAFYAAKAFAKVAGVPFKELDSYDQHVIHSFVGSMYGYTKDIAIKNAPEDFVYYTPKGLNYKTTVTTYSTNKNSQVTAAGPPHEEPFFHKFNDGSGNAYLTFMGSDQKTVKVQTGTNSPRKLLIIKDSYGNALPGYLFYSFGEVHVVDFRYFPKNLKQYVTDNGITDILLSFGIFNACGSGSMSRVSRMLTNNGSMAPSTPEAPKSDSTAPKKTESAEPAKSEKKEITVSTEEESSSSTKEEAPKPAVSEPPSESSE